MAETPPDAVGSLPRGETNMLRTILFAGAFAFLVAVPALADRDGHHGGGGDHHSAPEPLTMIGLGAGGAGLAYAKWKKNRANR
jgi:hypothetical protein